MHHLMRSTALADRPVGVGSLARARATHPAGTARLAAPVTRVVAADDTATPDVAASLPVAVGAPRLAEEDGSLVTEYGLLAVVAATIAGVVMTWASGGALVTLFNALLRQARSLVGA
jgi:Flp pilus assembly pilin Flp